METFCNLSFFDLEKKVKILIVKHDFYFMTINKNESTYWNIKQTCTSISSRC